MNFKASAAIAAAISIAVSLQAGAGAVHAAAQQPASKVATVDAAKKAHQQAIYDHMLKLLKQPSKQAEAVAYLEKNIYQVTPYQASMLTLRLENAQKANLDTWNNKFFSGSIQSTLMKIAKPGDDLTALMNRTKDAKLRSLFKDARDSGYQIKTSEGMFYLVMDYPRYQKFHPYVMDDIKSYIDIMSTETKAPVADDAALSISWSEVINRALSQQDFVNKYPKSNRVKQMEALYKQYLNTTFYGMNNTPLFDYDTKKMDSKAKEAFQKALANHSTENNSYLEKLQGFMDVLEKNNYKLTSEVEKYRKTAAPIG